MRSNRVRAAAAGAIVVSSLAGVALFDALGDAQTTGTSPIVQAGVDSSPAISDDGAIVVFQSEQDDGAGGLEPPTIVLHDRTDPTAPVTSEIADSEFGVRPGVSGDGCVVAWSIDATDPAPTPDDRLVVLDRCDVDGNPDDTAIPAAVTGIAAIDGSEELGAPALSLDGATIALSTGQEVVVLEATGGTYTQVTVTDGVAPPDPARVADDHLDVSDDGATVVFSAGPDADDADRNVFRFDGGAAATTLLIEDASHPDLSGDGTMLVATRAANIAVAVVPDTGSITETTALGVGSRPSISDDGNHVVFDTAEGVAIASWIGADAEPFVSVNDRTIAGVASATRSGPTIDRHGRLVATDTPFDDGDPETEIELTVFEAVANFGPAGDPTAVYDLGSGEVGDVLDATVEFTNTGPASFVIDDVSVGGTFVLPDPPGDCVGVLRAGTTCSFTVSFTVDDVEDAAADVEINPREDGSADAVAEVRALGLAPPTTTTTTTTSPTTTSTTTTTTTAGTTTGGSTTGGTSTGGSTTRGSTTGGTSTGGSTTRGTTSTTRTTTTTTTTTLPPGSGLVVSPASFEFAPTIVDSGRRTGGVEIVNSAAASATVESAVLTGDAVFTIATDGCSGVVLGEGERCTITIDFAPTAAGPATSELVAVAAGGRELTASLSGTGAPAPQLSAVPETARAGQVVTARGIGFPTGIRVDLVAGGDPIDVVVDSAGSFSHPVVIMAHTPSGPLEIVVHGQEDLFGDVGTTVLVRTSDDRAGRSVLDGPGINVGR